MHSLSIAPVPEARLDDLEPLWRSLYVHHSELTPHLADRSRRFEDAWRSRRETERRWLRSEPSSFVLAAQQGERYLGYAFVRVRSGAGFAESWSFADPLAELVTLAVLPDRRRQGVGSALLDAVESRLRQIGVDDVVIPVISTNASAARLYERWGAVPFVTEFVKRVSPS